MFFITMCKFNRINKNPFERSKELVLRKKNLETNLSLRYYYYYFFKFVYKYLKKNCRDTYKYILYIISNHGYLIYKHILCANTYNIYIINLS